MQLETDMMACIKMRKRVFSNITVSKGLKQGRWIALALFKIYLNKVLRSWRKKCCNIETPIEDWRLFTLHFADDQAILAKNEMDVSYRHRKLAEAYTKWGLKINVSKTEYLVAGGGG